MKTYTVTMSVPAAKTQNSVEVTGGNLEACVGKAVRLLVPIYLQNVKRRRPSHIVLDVVEGPADSEEPAE